MKKCLGAAPPVVDAIAGGCNVCSNSAVPRSITPDEHGLSAGRNNVKGVFLPRLCDKLLT